MACGEVVKAPQGIFCANFCHLVCDNTVCKSFWFPSCYIYHIDDMFQVNNSDD